MTDLPETMEQHAPYPTPLHRLVDQASYRPGWSIQLVDEPYRDTDPVDGAPIGWGLTLEIGARTVDSYDHEKPRSILHLFIVPAATYDERSWRRWLLDCLIKVETHEACEFLTIAGDKPYAPSHGPGNDPYLIREVGTDIDRRTSNRGTVNPD